MTNAPIPPTETFYYLATPYSAHPEGIKVAYSEACEAAAVLIGRGIPLFCPIAHSHGISWFGDLDPMSHDIWLPADAPFMDAASGLLVVHMPGWDASHGISHEIKVFTDAGKPVIHLDWPL